MLTEFLVVALLVYMAKSKLRSLTPGALEKLYVVSSRRFQLEVASKLKNQLRLRILMLVALPRLVQAQR